MASLQPVFPDRRSISNPNPNPGAAAAGTGADGSIPLVSGAYGSNPLVSDADPHLNSFLGAVRPFSVPGSAHPSFLGAPNPMYNYFLAAAAAAAAAANSGFANSMYNPNPVNNFSAPAAADLLTGTNSGLDLFFPSDAPNLSSVITTAPASATTTAIAPATVAPSNPSQTLSSVITTATASATTTAPATSSSSNHRLKSIPVLLLGSSASTRELLRLIVKLRSLHQTMGVTIRVVGVWYTTALYAVKDLAKGFSDENIIYFSQFQDNLDHSRGLLFYEDKKKSSHFIPNIFKHPGHAKVEMYGENAQEKLLYVAKKLAPTGLVVVDACGSPNIFQLLKKLLLLGCSLVCGNAHPFTLSLGEFSELVRVPRKINYDSAVVPGLPVIKRIRELLAIGETVYEVTGSLGGYFGEVLDLVEQGVLFSEALAGVKHKNSDATTIQEELEVIKRKAVIVGRSLGWKTSLHDISVDPLATAGINDLVLQKIENATKVGNVVRHVFQISLLSAKVGLEEFPRNSPLGRSSGREQIVEIKRQGPQGQSRLIFECQTENFMTVAKSLLAGVF